MTVKELIDQLQQLPNSEVDVQILDGAVSLPADIEISAENDGVTDFVLIAVTPK